MKRFVILLVVALMSAGFVFAEESTMIDFAILGADADDGINNNATLVDFSENVGTTFSDEDKEYMKTSLAIEQWEVELASSSRTVENETFTYVKEVSVNSDASMFGGETVLAARIHFPVDPYNSFAIIKPPFEIPSYEKLDEQDLKGSKFDGYGIVKNVGVLKRISVWLYGKNFPNGFGIVLKDQNNEEKIIFLDYTDFDGWRELTWTNPNYIADVRNRELSKIPLYPRSEPFYKLVGFIIYKDARQEGGDYITYIKDVNVVYDKAVLDETGDFNDEEIWGILGDREQARRTAEYKKLGEIQVLRYLEQQKMASETADDEQ